MIRLFPLLLLLFSSFAMASESELSELNEVVDAFYEKGNKCTSKRLSTLSSEEKALREAEFKALKDHAFKLFEKNLVSHKTRGLILTCLHSLADLPCDQIAAAKTDPNLRPPACKALYDDPKKQRSKAESSPQG